MFSFEKKTLYLFLVDIKILMIALYYYPSNPLRKNVYYNKKTSCSFENNYKARIALNLNVLKCVKTQELFRPQFKNYDLIDFTLTYTKCRIE